MRMSKDRAKLHDKALELLEQDQLTHEQKYFVLDNYHPGASSRLAAAFFTPESVAKDLSWNTVNPSSRKLDYVDLCAGIGRLSRHVLDAFKYDSLGITMTCIEINPEYVEVGKKVVPEANWICANAFDKETWDEVGVVDYIISNPPFGNVKTVNTNWLDGLPKRGEILAMAVCYVQSREGGVMIVPTNSVDFEYSGKQRFKRKDLAACDTGVQHLLNGCINLELNPCSVDLAYHKNNWEGVTPSAELVSLDERDEPRKVYRNATRNSQAGLFREMELREGIVRAWQ